MAHAGKKVVLRPVQLLNLLFLPLREGVFLLIHPIEKHEQNAGKQPHHNHGKRGVKQGGMLGVRRGHGGKIKGGAVTKQRLHRAQPKKHAPPPSLQSDADIDKAEHKPLRHTAVKAPRGKKGDGKQRQQHHRNERGARMDAFFLNADLDNHPHGGKACYQYQNIPNVPAHRQRKRDGDHADPCHNAKHPLAEADAVIADNLKPFLYHEVLHSSKHGIFRENGKRR